MPIFHGIKVNEPLEGVRDMKGISTAVIGLVATGSDADANTFPLNKAVLVTDVRSALGKAGTQGTLAKSLGNIADQCSPIIIVVRIAEGVASQGVTAPEATAINAIGATTNGVYTGMQALLSAETDVGIRPRILGAPGIIGANVTAALVVLAQRLRGFVYRAAATASVSAAIADRGNYGARELMLIYPSFTDWAGSGEACAMGLRARIDEQTGWHKTLSNVAVNGVTGISKNVGFDLVDSSNDAGLLNGSEVTTIIRMSGFRFWGNRTCSDEPKFAFESAVRTSQYLQDTIAQGLLWAVDAPLTQGLIRDMLESINAEIRALTNQGRLIGGSVWYDPSLNLQSDLAGGKIAIDYDYTPCAPAENPMLNQRITDRFYATFGDALG